MSEDYQPETPPGEPADTEQSAETLPESVPADPKEATDIQAETRRQEIRQDPPHAYLGDPPGAES